jgi:hypothetical protein
MRLADVLRMKRSDFSSLFIGTFAHLLIIILLSSCAQVVAPGGGPKDRIPPRALKYLPDSAQLQFNSRSIEILFDEYLQLKDLNSQLVISPPLAKTPEISVRKKSLIIALDKNEVLKPNTTYSIYLGNALQDLNEGNSKENFRYIFSTGSYIDSLGISGKVQNAFDHKTEKGWLVMLYSDMGDSVVYKSLPDYFARTKEDGSFQISNIRQANYKLVALKDANGNYKYDEGAEPIAFYKDTIFPALKQTILLEMFQQPEKKIRLKKYVHDQYGKVVITFNRGSDSLRVTNLSNTGKGVQEYLDFSKNNDTLTYWIKNFIEDTLKLQLNNGNQALDTLEINMIKKEEALKSKRKPFRLSLLNNFSGNQNVDLDVPLKLVFSQPIAQISAKGAVQLKEDSVLLKGLAFMKDWNGTANVQLIAKVDSTNYAEDPEKPGSLVNAPVASAVIGLKENTNYHLFVPPGIFTDIFGLTNDTIKIDFKTREQKFYGSLAATIKVADPAAHYQIQLLDEKDKVLREQPLTADGHLQYDYLQPGKYRFKLIIDENNNGKWDPGNYLLHKQPEKVIYNSETIMIRSNWDAELDWKVSE